MTVTWTDLPPQPWPEATEPDVEVLADWLLSLTRDQFVWLLGRQRRSWTQDSDCFIRNHEGQIRLLESRLLNIRTVLELHGISMTPDPS